MKEAIELILQDIRDDAPADDAEFIGAPRLPSEPAARSSPRLDLRDSNKFARKAATLASVMPTEGGPWFPSIAARI